MAPVPHTGFGRSRRRPRALTSKIRFFKTGSVLTNRLVQQAGVKFNEEQNRFQGLDVPFDLPVLVQVGNGRLLS